MKIEKIFYINLENRKDRRVFMDSYLEKFGIEYERFEAIRPSISSLIEKDGEYHEFFLRATNRFKSYVKNNDMHQRAMGVFGCYISHYLIHEKALRDGLGDYVILEDDCLIAPDIFSKIEQELKNGSIGEDWDIIRDCRGSREEVVKFNTSHKESLYSSFQNSHNFFGGSHFSVFKGTSKKRILEFLQKERLLAMDACYSNHIMNVYHGKFGATTDKNLGTDIPKLTKSRSGIKKAISWLVKKAKLGNK